MTCLNKSWKILKYSLLIILFTIALIATIIGFQFYNYHHIDKDCFARKVVLVKIAGTVLAVPRSYQPVFHAPEGKRIPYADKQTMLRVCQKQNDDPIEIRSFTLHIKNNFAGLILDSDQRILDFSSKHYNMFIFHNLIVQYQIAGRSTEETSDHEKEIKSEVKSWIQQADIILNAQSRR